MSKISNNKFDFYSSDEKVLSFIEKLKSQNKQYSKIYKALSLIGNFDKKVEVSLYDILEDEECTKVTLYFFDLDDSLFTICPTSNNKNDILKITKEDNTREIYYDLSILKKFELTEENIQLTRTSNVLNTRFGRLITDNKTFYSLFLGNNIAYQINIEYSNDSETVLTESLVKKLNLLSNVPRLMDYVTLFSNQLEENNCEFDELSLFSFKNFELVTSLIVAESNKNITNDPNHLKNKILIRK